MTLPGDHISHVIGIDEAGRGPLAGPVAVGAVAVSREHVADFERLFAGVKDSKKLSPQKRREWFELLRAAGDIGMLSWSVAFVSAQVIDRDGITSAIKRGIRSVLTRIELEPDGCHVLLDGSLRAPKQYHSQITIIHGDDTEMLISLASIAAKVLRDQKMENYFSLKYPAYGLEEHKGYGTDEHFRRIKKFGLSAIHRKSFLKQYTSAA